jgi:protein-L-isoaspartate O-methyltransferase
LITDLQNKKVTHPYATVIDGPLGGCGYGNVGDPQTYHPSLWAAMLADYEPVTVLDVGCGFGYSVKWFEDHGCKVLGLEGSEKIAEKAATKAVKHHDFRNGCPDLPGDFDLCWCSEFLEHVDREFEPNIFAAFCRCRVVVVGAALPGFGGHHHVNEQPSEYWIARFKEHGFRYDEEATERYRKLSTEDHPECYFRLNGLVFVRETVVEPTQPPRWNDIDGWLGDDEGKLLQHYGNNRRVLELGTYKGRSTVCLAQVAKQVTTVDTHEGDEGTGHADTRAEFLRNVERFGMASRIEPIFARIEDVRDELTRRRFDVVFIDSGHDAESVSRDTLIALECLLPGGTIIWHDFPYSSVKEGIVRAGLDIGFVTDCGGCGVMATARNQVAICLPHTYNAHVSSVQAAMLGCAGRYADRVAFINMACGSLTHNFNTMFAQCLAMRDAGKLTHMAMIHSDISADHGWVDVLSEEMCLTRAAVVSAVVAIKDPDDDRSSTAIGTVGDPWDIKRYIHMRERGAIPETFTTADVCEPDEVLLINTGVMLIDLREDFWTDCDGEGNVFAFQVGNRIIVDEDGKLKPQFEPEDWKMSRELHARGVPYASTFRPLTRHIGVDIWENRPGVGRINAI